MNHRGSDYEPEDIQEEIKMQTEQAYEDDNLKELRRISMRMNILIILIITMVLGIFWVFPFNIYIRLGVTTIMIISLYYQLMAYKYDLGSANMIGMKVQERMINEMGYQVTKRGHKILFKYVKRNNEEIIKVKESDLSKGKLKLLKWVSILHVLIKPAWGYREFDAEDEIDEALSESWYEIREAEKLQEIKI